MIEQKNITAIDQFISALPAGIDHFAESMRAMGKGLMLPSMAIRHWHEIPTKTEDGRDIDPRSSKSQWSCIAITGSRNDAAWLAEALRTRHPNMHFEVWSLYAFNNSSEPHIVDYYPDKHSEEAYHGKVSDNEKDIRIFAREYIIDYFCLHSSNHRYIDIQSCERTHGGWRVRAKFSQSGDIVALLIQQARLGLTVFGHGYPNKES